MPAEFSGKSSAQTLHLNPKLIKACSQVSTVYFNGSSLPIIGMGEIDH